MGVIPGKETSNADGTDHLFESSMKESIFGVHEEAGDIELNENTDFMSDTYQLDQVGRIRNRYTDITSDDDVRDSVSDEIDEGAVDITASQRDPNS